MGLVSAVEILNLETYDELNYIATNQKYQTELKKKQRLAEFWTNQQISNTNYFENIKNKC